MKNWKTSLAGILGAVFMLAGPRLTGDTTAPPITLGNVGGAVMLAVLGLASKDHNVTGGVIKQ